jgi:hypothetical protein
MEAARIPNYRGHYFFRLHCVSLPFRNLFVRLKRDQLMVHIEVEMTHRELPCYVKIVALVPPTQTKALVRVSRDPVFESVAKNVESIEDGAHETLTIRSNAHTPWFVVGESAALTLELTQTAVR